MPRTPTLSRRETLSIFAFAATVLIAVVCTAFATGWLIGRMLL